MISSVWEETQGLVLKPHFQGLWSSAPACAAGAGRGSSKLRVMKHHRRFANCCVNETCVLLALGLPGWGPSAPPSCTGLQAKAFGD